MAVILTPEACQLFREYRDAHRNVFLEEVVDHWHGFVHGANCAGKELHAIYRACVERNKELRPRGGKRGRPRKGECRVTLPSDSEVETELARFFASGSQDLDELCRVSERDRRQHGWFRDVCMVMGDSPTNRHLLIEQIVLFIREADRRELAAIREAVAEHRQALKRSKRGRPDVREDEELQFRARKAAWMHYVEGKTWAEVATALGMPREYGYSVDEVERGSDFNLKDTRGNALRRLVDYLAAAIWRAIPLNQTRVSAAGREIKPGALDYKPLQQYLRSRTGLPFTSQPEECKRIVEHLWPRGLKAEALLIERQFSYQKKKQKHPAD